MSTTTPSTAAVIKDNAHDVVITSPIIQQNGNIDEEELKVTFFPPLHAARSGWILNQLRRERVSSVLDVGCGEGSLMHALCIPAPFLRTHPRGASESTLNDSESESDSQYMYTQLAHLDALEIHIQRLYGLDISKPALETCIELTAAPPSPDLESDSGAVSSPGFRLRATATPRWEPLEVQLWHGSLAASNPTFIDVECIIATEVIEHLHPPALASFAPTLLGLYRPRLLLLTTPNYTFNARFTAPNASLESRIASGRGFLDPTGRTTRVFRHSDHKFEWTVDELKVWAQGVAEVFGYEVEVDAIGRADEDDPWGRDAELGGATQVALFRRVEDWKHEGEGESLGVDKAPKDESEEAKVKHVLLKTWFHEAHPQSGLPQDAEAIQALVTSYMEEYYFAHGYTIWDLWVEPSIAAACGGYLDVLIHSLQTAPDLFTLDYYKLDKLDDKLEERSRSNTTPKPTEWVVKFSGERHHAAVAMCKSRGLGVWDVQDDTLSRLDEAYPHPDPDPDPGAEIRAEAEEAYGAFAETETDRRSALDADDDDWGLERQLRCSTEQEGVANINDLEDREGELGGNTNAWSTSSNTETWGSTPSWADSDG